MRHGAGRLGARWVRTGMSNTTPVEYSPTNSAPARLTSPALFPPREGGGNPSHSSLSQPPMRFRQTRSQSRERTHSNMAHRFSPIPPHPYPHPVPFSPWRASIKYSTPTLITPPGPRPAPRPLPLFPLSTTLPLAHSSHKADVLEPSMHRLRPSAGPAVMPFLASPFGDSPPCRSGAACRGAVRCAA